MTRIEPYNPAGEEEMHFSPVYKSFASSFLICLWLSALVLVGLLFKLILEHHRRPSLGTDSAFQSNHNMSNSKQPSLPPPSPQSFEFDPFSSDPLAGVYYPITSGQLAVLAEKKAQEPERRQSEDKASRDAESNNDTRGLQAQLDAYVQYYNDRENNETWQRRTVFYKTARDGNQDNT